ncbi:MAG: 2-amino-4-hydroxy-6-hydroxymethyldihydropteridine diphosphokinase [Desulfobulbaceae bacterium]|jgi:2-amino-4-hydroxy-6-hydroxymethyldihydropteridine diphosphokinase|nr:2-amino-4-hydroxy-6-hydroxymethyldihydropteridine diphosphokinase [Desulfobulbaceae bacterium]
MALVFIGLGSNLGDTRGNVLQSWKKLGCHSDITLLTLSSPYKTAPVGMESDNWFTNAVGVLQTSLSPRDLLQEMLSIEQEMGRDRSVGMDRTIDLDILYYDDVIISEPDLEIPHPEISRRLFVLAPLAEVAPDHIHPVLEQSSHMLQRRCPGDDVQKGAWR